MQHPIGPADEIMVVTGQFDENVVPGFRSTNHKSIRTGILCASRPCHRVPLPWLSVKGLNIGDGIYVFVLAQLAASNECVGCVCLSVFEFILQANNLRGNGNRFSASNTRHPTVALHQFRNHLNLTKGICRGLGELEKAPQVFETLRCPKSVTSVTHS